jgi:hypothetical protein
MRYLRQKRRSQKEALILMHNRKTFTWILSFLIIMAGMIGFGCDKHKKQIKKQEKPGAMTFVNASKGLPSTGQWRQSIAFADLNGDSHLDILAPAPRKAAKEAAMPHGWYGNGRGEWTRADLHFPKDTTYDYGGIAVGDFDGDSVLDVGLAMHGMGLKVFRGMGDGRFEDLSNGLPSTREFMSRAVISGKFSDDGSVGLAAASEADWSPDDARPSGMRVCTLGREGNWSCSRAGVAELVEDLYADTITCGDVNGDGVADIALGSLHALRPDIVWINDGKGNLTPFNDGLPKGLVFFSVALADLDHDGRDDLVAAVSGLGRQSVMGIKAFLSRVDGWKEHANGLPAEAVWCVDACDLDRDGTMEIVAGMVGGGIRVYSLSPDGWREVSVSGLPQDGPRIYGLYCVDVNGDGFNDIALNCADDKTDQGHIQVYLNQQKRADK